MDLTTGNQFADAIVGLLIILGGGGGIMKLKRLGLVSFGRGNNSSIKCPEPLFKATVEQTIKEVDSLAQTIDKNIFPKINKTAEDVSFIRGWIEGQDG